ncbi:MAG TPA: NAD(P) transhydrogenase subunit alpha [Cyclobacteriaceae bacterium]|nr:NAD(P) transhydrogenase subunit alpha [Cyclobacteriaceae bacterium]
MIIGIIREQDDTRVSIVPEVASKLGKDGNEIWVEPSAGASSYFSDQEYEKIGAKIKSREEILRMAGLNISITALDENEIMKMHKSAIYISSFHPYMNEEIVSVLGRAGITALSLDMIPRITMAQTMDILSSMASISGYKAVIMAAGYLPRYFPMLTTAAGSIPPSRVLILGAGVAGLQAIATARRLGSIVEAFDTRHAAKEEVESLGAKFVEVEGAKDDKKAGGYAVEQTEEYKTKQRELIADRVSKSDVVITTALLRSKLAPILITREMVESMKQGSVIVDLAASAGGNCELTRPGEIARIGTITIIGIKELSSTLPLHASQLYCKNIFNYIKVFLNQGVANIDLNNEIMKHSAIVLNGEIRYHK